jgi:hypothetical protein
MDLHHCLSEGEGFLNLTTFYAAINHFMKKAKEVGKIDPKPAVEAPGVNSPVHKGVVPLDHHEPFAFEALHKSPWTLRSTQTVQH